MRIPERVSTQRLALQRKLLPVTGAIEIHGGAKLAPARSVRGVPGASLVVHATKSAGRGLPAVPLGRLWRNWCSIGAHSSQLRDALSGIVDSEGGGLVSPTQGGDVRA